MQFMSSLCLVEALNSPKIFGVYTMCQALNLSNIKNNKNENYTFMQEMENKTTN